MTALLSSKIGEGIELPPRGTDGLNPPVAKGDTFLSLCRIVGGGGWLCSPYVVKYLCGDQPAYRPKWAKVDKLASEWITRPLRPAK